MHFTNSSDEFKIDSDRNYVRPAKKANYRPLFLHMRNIWKTRPDSWTITIKQNVQFQVGICSVKFQLDQIKNGRLSAIINFNMPDIWQTVPYS